MNREPQPVTIVAHDVGGVGGMERQLAELIAGLRNRGHPVTVIAWKCELEPGVEADVHLVGGPRRPFPFGYLSFMVLGSLALRRRRRGVVQATGAIVLNPVDVLAIHCCHQVYRAAPRRAGALYRVYETAVGLMKRFGERAIVERNRRAAIVCVSEGVADEMREHYPRAAGRVLAIHNGVDTDLFSPGGARERARGLRASNGIPAGRLVVSFVARGWGHKGLGELIEALAQAPAWDLFVAGSGDEQTYSALADRVGVAGRIHWLGVVGDVQTVYAASDAFAMASSYETFSLVTFEAAATGLPVLATDVNGVRELVNDGTTGFIVRREAADIARRLNELAGDAELRERVGAAAREAALAFSWERMVDRHVALYSALAAR